MTSKLTTKTTAATPTKATTAPATTSAPVAVNLAKQPVTGNQAPATIQQDNVEYRYDEAPQPVPHPLNDAAPKGQPRAVEEVVNQGGKITVTRW